MNEGTRPGGHACNNDSIINDNDNVNECPSGLVSRPTYKWQRLTCRAFYIYYFAFEIH